MVRTSVVLHWFIAVCFLKSAFYIAFLTHFYLNFLYSLKAHAVITVLSQTVVLAFCTAELSKANIYRISLCATRRLNA